MFTRALILPPAGTETFFLWGARQTGKSTLLRETYRDALWVDLLRSDQYRRYLEAPERLREELAARPDVRHVVIDEVQKVPALLDEVHGLMESTPVTFALCGSSARKVRRGHANLLGGRALRYELYGLSAHEIGPDFDLTRLLNHGYLPRIFAAERPERLLRAYVSDYLREEVAAEGLVRNLPVFSEFLNVAALDDTGLVSFANIARECGVSGPTVKGYYEILVDTLLGRWLRAWRRRPKRRTIGADKFYFSDVGVVNVLARRGRLEPGSELYGRAFESWVLHELCVWNACTQADAELTYWRLASGVEVDFVVGDMQVAIEAKASRKITTQHLRGLTALAADHPEVRQRVIVCLEPVSRRTRDGVLILTPQDFVRRLWEGELAGF